MKRLTLSPGKRRAILLIVSTCTLLFVTYATWGKLGY